jgi:hypothetical protein
VKRIIAMLFPIVILAWRSQIQSCAALIRGFNFLGRQTCCPDADEPTVQAQRFSVKSACHGQHISSRLKVLNPSIEEVLRFSSCRLHNAMPRRYLPISASNACFLSMFELVQHDRMCR